MFGLQPVLAISDLGLDRVIAGILDILPVALGQGIARLRLRQRQRRLLHLRLGLGLGSRKPILAGLEVGLRLGQRRLGRRDILGPIAGLHLRQRALGRIARRLRLDDLGVELLRVLERLLRVLVGLRRAVACRARLIDRGLGSGNIFGPAAGLEQRQISLGHRHGSGGLVALGFQQRRVELRQRLAGGHLLALIHQQRLDAARNLAGDQHLLGLDRAGAAQRAGAGRVRALVPPPIPSHPPAAPAAGLGQQCVLVYAYQCLRY